MLPGIQYPPPPAPRPPERGRTTLPCPRRNGTTSENSIYPTPHDTRGLIPKAARLKYGIYAGQTTLSGQTYSRRIHLENAAG